MREIPQPKLRCPDCDGKIRRMIDQDRLRCPKCGYEIDTMRLLLTGHRKTVPIESLAPDPT